MILIVLVGWLFVGGVLAWISGRWSKIWPRWISLISLFLHLGTLIWLWITYLSQFHAGAMNNWFVEIDLPWIPQLGINLHFGLDGLSLLLILLTNFLGIMSVAASWKEIQDRVGFFHFNLMLILTALAGVFLSLDPCIS
jgi:NADH-quinone oxidoreductase subunit M